MPRLRRAARILLLDPDDRLLLFRYCLSGRPPFWCGPGGECDPGEDFAAAAVRELWEETGLRLTDCGPERAQRGGEFATLTGEWIRSDERFFLVRADRFTPSYAGHTAVERAAQMSHRWFTRAELAEWPELIFPVDLPALLDSLTPAH
ncbi:NUDIX domain-containing protein [Novosphingobium piscinae]|uniref:NUDIX domain-containing protein n=1 Tax=Novosphingobium piscinae TaxID=1507448 RepID=A0A7X1FXJ9_9SPHN|nr:NUDIX domain-containing protein [Novosphingobium piscinae]MBC2668724.1 NUDIX domain-containing protein [Novosphingobium piscinae]